MVDLPRVRRALTELDQVAARAPWAFGNLTARGWERVLHEELHMGETKVVSFRLPVELLERVDKLSEHLAKQAGGIPQARADVVKMLLGRALEAEELKLKKTRKK